MVLYVKRLQLNILFLCLIDLKVTQLIEHRTMIL